MKHINQVTRVYKQNTSLPQFRAAQKLPFLTRLKSKLNVLSQSGVVYQISCSQCEAFYVGKTKRRLEQRVQEHSQQGYSSLYKLPLTFVIR